MAVKTGIVHIVGAGPGDPELLTLKALRLLRAADVVVYDRLVAPEVLDQAAAGTMRIYAGKAPGAHHLPQDEINALLVRLARAGRTVVRLKGGDPFVFGRGSEEAAHLAAAGVAFTVVPGITAATGCAAALGIPLSHRGVASGVRFVTGHCRAEAELALDWTGLADPETTLVVYMALSNLESFAASLIAAGLDAATPAVAIARGTTTAERCCRATLGNLAREVERAGLDAPVLLIIGAVVALADTWNGLVPAGSEAAAPARRAEGGHGA